MGAESFAGGGHGNLFNRRGLRRGSRHLLEGIDQGKDDIHVIVEQIADEQVGEQSFMLRIMLHEPDSRSKMPAAPMPPPTHIVTSP